MSYEIIFQDKTSTVVSNEDGEQIKEILLTAKTPQPLEINGEFYKSNYIVSIKHAADPVVYAPKWDIPVIKPGTKCRGQHSIQNEINKIARSYGKIWPKLIRDMDWREETRQKLRATTSEWCDYRENQCACDPEFNSTSARHERVL